MYKEEYLYNPKVLNKADFGNATGFKLLLGSRLKTADNNFWCDNRVRYNFDKNYYQIEKQEYMYDMGYTLSYVCYWYFFTQDTTIDGVTYSNGIWRSEHYSLTEVASGAILKPTYKKTKWRGGSADLYTGFGYFYFDLENMVNFSTGMDSIQDEFKGYSTITDYNVSKTFNYTLGVSTTDYPDLVRSLLSGTQYGSISELFEDMAKAVQELKGDNSRKILGSALPYEIRTIALESENGLPINVSTPEAMNALLVSENVGKVYKYTGTTKDSYTNGNLYIVEDV